jgi:2'-5' RNA ligase
METTLFTCTFALPRDITKELQELNGRLSEKYSTNFVSEFVVYTPHVTIYQAEFPTKNNASVLQYIEKISASVMEHPISFIPTGVNVRGRYVAIAFQNTNDIAVLHRQVVESLNSLREGLIKKNYRQSSSGFSDKEEMNIRLWGYPYVMEEYKPHLTILALENGDKSEEVAKEIRFSRSFSVNQLRVVQSSVDSSGNKTRAVYVFPDSNDN